MQTRQIFFKPIISVLSVLLVLRGISAQCLTGNDSPSMMGAGSKKAIIDSKFRFALETLKKISLFESQDNIIYSPYSIHQAVTLAYFGSRGTTEEALKRALQLPADISKVDVQRYYSFENTLKQQINGQNDVSSNYEFNSANRLWISDKKKVRECILSLFGNQLEMIDFKTNPNAVRDQINNWVSNMTKGHIRDLLPPNSITTDTDLVLANAVYFKGLWKSRFNPNNSKKDIFYSSKSQHSMVKYMRQQGNFNHVISEILGAHVLELPYKGNEISMFILLPPFVTKISNDSAQNGERDSIYHLIERLSTEAGYTEIRDLLTSDSLPQPVEIILPRFEVEKELQITTLLDAIGAGELVMPDVANLKGFVEDGEESVHLGAAVHRARIEVTEEGTTAAAATAIYTFRSGRPLVPTVFNANHPFVYFIYEKPKRTILFAGIYRNPNTQKNAAETA
ncbi:serine protease inhibitor 88Ea isoform X1 [Apis mellifera]|uniref:Serine protease inhibitor 88Ea isoform X1 n=2 Tax=Apis mellifera TaxID=7460 RepID=A0A7M7LMV8_APIME|nr:serine protease inhibitor 88Ea isoform X1 [Apis mellifera]|eukprot:XP_006562425.1 serine protease inhibitor 88Ea isoform X1 [Apis mellifera]